MWTSIWSNTPQISDCAADLHLATESRLLRVWEVLNRILQMNLIHLKMMLMASACLTNWTVLHNHGTVLFQLELVEAKGRICHWCHESWSAYLASSHGWLTIWNYQYPCWPARVSGRFNLIYHGITTRRAISHLKLWIWEHLTYLDLESCFTCWLEFQGTQRDHSYNVSNDVVIWTSSWCCDTAT